MDLLGIIVLPTPPPDFDSAIAADAVQDLGMKFNNGKGEIGNDDIILPSAFQYDYDNNFEFFVCYYCCYIDIHVQRCEWWLGRVSIKGLEARKIIKID